MYNILITGITGMLGSSIYKVFIKDSSLNLFGFTRKSKKILPGVKMVSGYSNFLKQFKKIHFNKIIHCAAEVNINFCEEFKSIAYEANVSLTMRLINDLSFDDFIFISSDSVYQSVCHEIKSENDKTNPLNYYSETKLLSENYIKSRISKYYVLRTNIYGFSVPFKNSLFEWAFNQLSIKKKIHGFENVIFNPLYIGQLSHIILKIINEKIPYGIYNVGSLKPISKYNFLRMVVNRFNLQIKFLEKSLYNIKSLPPRPLYTAMDITKLKSFIDYDFSIEKGFNYLVKDFKNQIEL
jgi:dTDP-4-dehydrorhamnose reductase